MRKTYIGTVASISGNKTIQVAIRNTQRHPLYGKRVVKIKNFSTHDEHNLGRVGDKVRIRECRPLSATKRFELVEVIEKAIVLEGGSDN